MSPNVVAAFAAVLIGMLSGTVPWVIARRQNSGSVRTSDAEEIFKASTSLLSDVRGERDKAIEQRDKLLDAKTRQDASAFAAINAGLGKITELAVRQMNHNDDVINRLDLLESGLSKLHELIKSFTGKNYDRPR
jgi:hypothetical protein